MILKKVAIENFRMLKKFDLLLKQNLSLIVGKNNSGKTSLLTAMDRFLNFDTHLFSWNDFNLEFQKEFFRILNESNPYRAISDIGGIKLVLYIEYSNEDKYTNIQNLMLDLNPKNNIVVLEFKYSVPEENSFKLINDCKKFSIDTFEDFTYLMKKNSNKYFRTNAYARGFDIDKNKTTKTVSSDLDKKTIQKIIRFKSIKANRDASNKYNDHSLSSLSSKYYEHLKGSVSEDVGNFEKTILETDQLLNKVYKEVFSEISNSVAQFGGLDGETSISIQSSLKEKELLAENTTLYYQHDGIHLPESYNGLGYLNLIGMIFEIETIIANFHGNEDIEKSDINLLFIEEPEAHTHPQLQYIFIKNIKNLIKKRSVKDEEEIALQTIMTTHSSHIVTECDFEDIRFLKKKNGSVISKNIEDLKRLYDNDDQVFTFIKQYLTLNRSELFFADKAIFVEGDTERILLPAIMKKMDLELGVENPLLSQNISIIEVGAYSYVFGKLISFLGIKTLIITDIDAGKSEEKTYKNGKKVKKVIGCNPKDAKLTTNPSLKRFFGKEDFTFFVELKGKSKTLRFSQKTGDEQYKINQLGNIRIAYQITEEDNQASSFEDAFIHINLEFLKTKKDNFINGLKNIKKLDSNLSAYELANKCIRKKTSFAMEVLLTSSTDYSEWNIPRYIKEGLEWLQE